MARKNSLLPIDELNVLGEYIDTLAEDDSNQLRKDIDVDYLIDTVLDVLIMSYVFGIDSANEDIGTNLTPNEDNMRKSIYKKIDNKDFQDRIRQYCQDGGTTDDIKRIADTETHRNYNQGQYDTAKSSNLNITKYWVTMLDEKVRDTHVFLEGVGKPLDEMFYTYDGDSALTPGGFETAQNNVNCRCELTFVVEKGKEKNETRNTSNTL